MKRLLTFIWAILSINLFAQQHVNIGDILCTDGSTIRVSLFPSSGKTAMGVVYYVDPSGLNGLAVNLYDDEVNTPFGGYGDDFPLPDIDESRKAIYDFDGYRNTEILRNMYGGASAYPAPWSVDFDNGWYLPAAGELRLLYNQILVVNNSLGAIGATPLFRDTDNYWSSTERSCYHIHDMTTNGNLGNYTKVPCNNAWVGVRSIRSFSTNSSSFPIGEVIVNDDGSKGIVFYANPDEKAYWMVALNDAPSTHQWGDHTDSPLSNVQPEKFFELLDESNGMANTNILRNYQSNNSYAAFQVDFENGWYLPSAGQLSRLYGMLPLVEDSIRMHGGTLMRSEPYWTSTEYDEDMAWCIDYGSPGQYGGFSVKTNKTTNALIRAIHDFDPESLQPSVGDITAPEAICSGNSLDLQTPSVQHATFQEWQIAADESFTGYQSYNGEALDESYDGWYLRYVVSNFAGTVYSNAVRVSVMHAPSSSFSIESCGPYVWNGATYTESGIYQQAFPMPDGCDSIVTLYLSIGHEYDINFNASSCESYTWNGQTYMQSGDYTQVFTSIYGCDSIATLHLSIYKSTESELSITECDSYVWNGQTYTTSGDYTQTLHTTHGCDSLVTLHLTIESFEEMQAIEGDTAVDTRTTSTSLYTQPGFNNSTYQWVLLPDQAGTVAGFGNTAIVTWSTDYRGEATLGVGIDAPCGEGFNTLTINVKNSADISENSISAKLYPNPTSGSVTIEATGMQHITVMNTLGQVVVDMALDTDATNIDMTRFGKGVYVVRIQTIDGSCIRRIGVE